MTSSSFAQANSALFADAWRNEIQKNALQLNPATLSAVHRVYQTLGYQMQFVWDEDQHKVRNLVGLQWLVAKHGLNPSKYPLEQIAASYQSREERELRLVVEVIKIAQDLNIGRVSPEGVARHVKFKERNFERIADVANLIRNPTEANLDSFAPDYEEYWNIVNALQRQGAGLSSEDKEKAVLTLEKFRWLPENPGPRYLFVNTSASMLKVIDPQLEATSPIALQRVINGKQARPTPSMLDEVRSIVLNPTWTLGPTILVQDKLPVLIRTYQAAANKAREEALAASSSAMAMLRVAPGANASGAQAFDFEAAADQAAAQAGARAVGNYLDSRNFEIIQGGRVVSASAINWASVKAGRRPNFTLRQLSGDDNALGVLKIMLHNRALSSAGIWLHDTSDRGLFRNFDRRLSSGCIRVEHPHELAAYLLEGTSTDLNDVVTATSGAVADRSERHLRPGSGRNLPVITLHNTARFENGELKFSRDYYREDAGLKRALERAGHGTSIQLN